MAEQTVSSEECEFAGHQWAPAGGGLLICVACGSEQWDDAAPVSSESEAQHG